MQVRSLFTLFTVGTVFAACALLSASVPVQHPDSLAITLNPVTPVSGTQVQRITFPDMVTPQSLKRVEPVENRRDQIDLRFVNKPKSDPLPQGAHEIWIPEKGSFKVRYKAGNSFAVLDPDGTDGEAVVQMPVNQSWEGFLQTVHSDDKETVASLILEDPLYYVKQQVFGKDEAGLSKLWRLGVRAFPVPADWHGPDGADYVMRFATQHVLAFTFRWAQTTAVKPDFPPGIAQIGPEGGVVELPGVAKLELPSGALTQKTTVSIKQTMEAPSIKFSCSSDCSPKDFVSPVIQIQPEGRKLSKPGMLYLPTDLKRVGRMSPASVHYIFNKTLDVNNWISDVYTPIFPYIVPDSISWEEWDSQHNRPIGISEFGYFSKEFPADLAPDGGLTEKYKNFIENNGVIPTLK